MATTQSHAVVQALEPLAFPEDAIEVGRIVGAWGIKGAFKVLPHASDPQALHSSRRWFLRPAEGKKHAVPALLHVSQARAQAGVVVATAQEIEDRDAAEALSGAGVFVSRTSFPSAGADEYYWVDLLGATVRNREGVLLGVIEGLIDTGAHSVMRLSVPADAADTASAGAEAVERLIPFVAHYVDTVDLERKQITVDWQPDY